MTAIYKSESGRQAIEAFYRKALARWPMPNQQQTLATRHGDTFVVACGPASAPPVVLLHGSGSNSAVWMRDVVEWGKANRVYAVDIIGEPGLSAPSRPPLHSDAYAQWLDDVLERLRLPSASVVGVSLGGWIALDYAVRRPARVASLSLLSPAGIGARRRLFMLKAMVMLAFGKIGVRKALPSALGTESIPAPIKQYLTLIFENFRPRREAPPLRTDRELRALSMPVQVILGANDAMLKSAETRERLRRLVSQAEITWLPDAGHMLPPQTARVADFLNTAPRARAASSSAETGAVSSNVAFQLASQSDVQV